MYSSLNVGYRWLGHGNTSKVDVSALLVNNLTQFYSTGITVC